MVRYKILIEYDGSGYLGWQIQHDGPSIQESIQKAIYSFCQVEALVYAAGRTDAGVHAVCQVAHFDLPFAKDLTVIKKALNYYLNNSGVVILNVELAPKDFHARFSALSRAYEYYIVNRQAPVALRKNRVWHISQPLNINDMKKAADKLLGYHDFNSFRSSQCQSKSSYKSIEKLFIDKKGDEICFSIEAKSFLHNQVRIIVGTLVQIGLKKNDPQYIDCLLECKDRNMAGATAPAYGLYLTKVKY